MAPQRSAGQEALAAERRLVALSGQPRGAVAASPRRPPGLVVAAARAERAEIPESPLVAALWAESAQQVLDRGTVRVCHNCALPVSTQARFCRRCGTRQG